MAVQGGNPKKRSFGTYDKKSNNHKDNYSKSKPDFKGKGKFTPKPKVEKDEPKRKRPITSGGGEEDLDYDEVEIEADGDGDVAMDEPAEKKPRMSKSEKAALHAAQPHRTALLPSYPLLQDTLLPLWETARKTDVPKEERTKAVKELYQAVKGRILEISKGHKGGRVLQTVSYEGLPK
jgi:pumilio family protein 6